MPRQKIYECCICHEILTGKKPVRLVKQLYGDSGYKQYYPVQNYDFCDSCYKKFDRWVGKHIIQHRTMDSPGKGTDDEKTRV